MPDNLTIPIIATTDFAKARGELRALQAELKNLDRQINAAGKAGDTARVKELSNAFGVLKERAVGLSGGLNQVKRSADEATNSLNGTGRAGRRLISELGSLRGFGGLLGGLGGGGTATGLIGAGVGLGLEKLIAQFEDLAKSMREIRDLSRETAGKPLLVQGMQELAKESGESAEKANKFLTGTYATLAKIATAKRDMQTGLPVGADGAAKEGQNFANFGDKTVQVLRGGVTVIRDFSDALAILQVNQANLIRLSPEKQTQRLGEAFLRAEKNAKQLGLTEINLNEISKQIFGVPAEDADKLIAAYAKVKAKEEELRNSQRGATKEHQNNIDEVAKAQEKLAQQIAESTSKAANASKDARAGFLLSLADFIKSVDTMTQKAADGTVDILKDAGSVFGRFLRSLISGAEAATGPQGALGQAGPMGPASASISLPDVSVSATRDMPTVLRGSGPGDTGGYGPNIDFGPGSGHGPRGLAFGESAGDPGSSLQSVNPGLSNYQAAPAHMVSPIAYSAGMGWASDAAKSSADAAAASKTAAEASANAVKAWVDQPALASGGMVHGPGTATSDSVMARLSTGEFVMRAAAVNKWGAGFMSAINGYADGGLVMPTRGIPSYADGGLVTAGTGGRAVHLHLGGNSFALAGSESVVGALVSEAHSQQIRSAGVKPSWFAGRPSGR
jgi:hypothetical protein